MTGLSRGWIACSPATAEPKLEPERVLTRRQLQIAILVGQGRSNPQIARSLNLSRGYVKNQIAAIYSRLGWDQALPVIIEGKRARLAAVMRRPT